MGRLFSVTRVFIQPKRLYVPERFLVAHGFLPGTCPWDGQELPVVPGPNNVLGSS